jgi:hypothetical protein
MRQSLVQAREREGVAPPVLPTLFKGFQEDWPKNPPKNKSIFGPLVNIAF